MRRQRQNWPIGPEETSKDRPPVVSVEFRSVDELDRCIHEEVVSALKGETGRVTKAEYGEAREKRREVTSWYRSDGILVYEAVQGERGTTTTQREEAEAPVAITRSIPPAVQRSRG
jgi:hypothetical protein